MINKRELLFPFDNFRKGQDAILTEVSNTIKNKKNLIIHAPTGLGKTAATLPAALAHAIKHNLTIFFLTSRHTQHIIALETLKNIKEKYSLNFLIADFIAKKYMCPLPGSNLLSSSEFNEYCKILREKDECNFYLNVKKKNKFTTKSQVALREISDANPIPIEEITEICEKHEVCPFEINCALAQKAHVIICDYYHVLNPSIRKFMFKKMQKDLKNSIIIIDESHNLPQRLRELLTSNISTFLVDLAIREAKNFDQIREDLTNIKNILLNLSRDKLSVEKTEELITKTEFSKNIEEPVLLQQTLNLFAETIIEEKKKSYAKSVANFLSEWPGPEQGFVRILTRKFLRNGKINFVLSYKCLDPSLAFKPVIEEAYSTILMSGTLKPTEMYRDLLGFDEKITLREYKNPFPKENKLTLVIPDVTSKYSQRSSEMYEKIAQKTSEIVNSVPGNTIVFFPSYDFRDNVNKYFETLCTKTTFFEHSKLTKQEKEELLSKFKSYNKKGAVLLAVSNASFGQSIDLPGDLLKAVVIVGLPLTKPDLETQALIQYYDEKFKKGWDYGYIMPAIIRSMQNAGRCIRTETDKGVVVFLEERYSFPRYLKCLPSDFDLKISNKPVEIIEKFFNT